MDKNLIKIETLLLEYLYLSTILYFTLKMHILLFMNTT